MESKSSTCLPPWSRTKHYVRVLNSVGWHHGNSQALFNMELNDLERENMRPNSTIGAGRWGADNSMTTMPAYWLLVASRILFSSIKVRKFVSKLANRCDRWLRYTLPLGYITEHTETETKSKWMRRPRRCCHLIMISIREICTACNEGTRHTATHSRTTIHFSLFLFSFFFFND